MHIHMAMTSVPNSLELDIKAVSTETAIVVNCKSGSSRSNLHKTVILSDPEQREGESKDLRLPLLLSFPIETQVCGIKITGLKWE